MTPTVSLFGASVRWLAQSARRTGFKVRACDLFADEDLREIAETRRVSPARYPEIFAEIAEKWPSVPRVYTGGLENHPEVVECLARTGPLWGCSPEALRACRTPTALIECGLKTPEVKLDAAGVLDDGRWLQKPMKGSAGRGIKRWRGGELPSDRFLQQRVDGEPVSASFFANEDSTVLIGAASLLVGDLPPTDAPPFAYAGGIAPLELSAQTRSSLCRTGETLRTTFGLRGLFGVDAIRNGDNWTFLEINPRPTASMELFELAGVASVFGLHHAAFGGPLIKWKSSKCVAGKAILYAASPGRLIKRLPATKDELRFADRPSVGTEFQTGEPVATVLATGISMEDVRANLQRGVRTTRERLSDRR